MDEMPVLRKPRRWHKGLLPITTPLYLVATVAIWVYIAGLYLLARPVRNK